MERYLALISGFLQKEESCYLPGLGVLRVIRESAKEEQGQLQPPQSKVQLDSEGKVADHAIVQEIQSRFPTPDRDAATQWDQCLRKIKKQLQAGKTVPLPALGHFEEESEGNIRFVTQDQTDYFGPLPIGRMEDAVTAEENRPAPVGEQNPDLSPIASEGTSSNRRLWGYVLVPLLLLAAGYLGYRYWFDSTTQNPASGPNRTPTENTAPPLLSSPPATDSVQARESTKAGTNGQTSDSIHFSIIYRVYQDREDADKQYRRMRNWGHDVVLYTPDSGLFMLGYPYYERPADTARRLEEIETIYGGTPFVFYPRK